VRRAFGSVLAARGVRVHLGAEVERVDAGRLRTAAGEVLEADEIVWVTQAGGAAWLAETGLALDEAGFIRVNDTLQSETDPLIFAAGDCAAMAGTRWKRPASSPCAWACRWRKTCAAACRRSAASATVRSALAGPDQHRRPARRRLARRAVCARRLGLALEGLDRPPLHAQVHRIAAMPPGCGAAQTARRRWPLDEAEKAQAISAIAMRCGGCGAKVGATVLSRALAGLQPVARDDVLIGLHAPDDAAVVRVPPGKAMVHSVDFFRAFIDDPWVFGRIAANHALGDIFAMGAEPQSATAIATVPPGLEPRSRTRCAR
jgi:selenide,water dikinase